jgi:hypothetical protein
MFNKFDYRGNNLTARRSGFGGVDAIAKAVSGV